MKTLSGSLAALAIVAARDGCWTDVARLIAQAACAPDTEDFLECELADNFQANCLINSVSNASSLSDSVAALSAALELNAEEERAESLYGDDEVISLNSDEDGDDVIDLGDEDESENDEELDDEDISIESDSSTSSLIRLRFDD